MACAEVNPTLFLSSNFFLEQGMDVAGGLGETATWTRRMLFSRKEGTRGRGSRASLDFLSDEINHHHKAEAANQDSHSYAQHFTWERKMGGVSLRLTDTEPFPSR